MAEDSIPFPLPRVSTTSTTWGPPPTSTCTKFHLLPYAPFGRNDRLGRCADFTSSSSTQFSYQYQNRRNDYRRGGGTGDNGGQNAEFQYKVQADDFELVDSSKGQTGSGGRSMYGSSAQAKRKNQNRLRQLNSRRYDSTSSAGGRGSGGYQSQFQKIRGGRFQGRGGMSGRGGRGGRGGWRERIDRQPSVSVKTDWNMVHEMDLNKMTKSITNNAKPSKEEDLLWCGFVDRYNDVYDKCSTKNPATLKRSENKEFYPVTTTDDPVIEKVS